MNSYTNQLQENKKSLNVTQKRNNNSVISQFSNQHPATVAQIQLQEIANNSKQVKQAMQLQAIVNANSSLPIQKQGIEEEEAVQMKVSPIQRQGIEEEESLQMKANPIQKQGIEEEESLQMKANPIQKQGIEEEESLQMKANPIQKQSIEEEEAVQGKFALPIQKKANNTGLPNDLKSGIENLSGFAMDDVKVHYNSDKPAQLQAHAYAQGTDIHVASGQEKHLPHEAWHVVQQKQGRVQPTLQMKGNVNVNDDAGLENEADVMGAKAFQFVNNQPDAVAQKKSQEMVNNGPYPEQTAQFKELFQKKDIGSVVIQKFDAGIGSGWHIHYGDHVKYASTDETRVNFGGRTRRQIGYAWEQKIKENGLAETKGTADFISCKTWIRNNL